MMVLRACRQAMTHSVDKIKDLLISVAEDETAFPKWRNAAKIAAPSAELIRSHYSGDGAGWQRRRRNRKFTRRGLGLNHAHTARGSKRDSLFARRCVLIRSRNGRVVPCNLRLRHGIPNARCQ